MTLTDRRGRRQRQGHEMRDIFELGRLGLRLRLQLELGLRLELGDCKSDAGWDCVCVCVVCGLLT